ncbi:MAG: OB-fold nucleic acid binding domain-containing protein [Actinomycetaceae bacterium]|nr:OB-fold nucleic acid binding domain-containing protein [Actinomycetaceae bacterium]
MARRINATGTVVALTYPGYGQRPEVRVTVESKAGVIDLIFQSRRNIRALDIGQNIAFAGAVVDVHGTPAIYNPKYHINKGEHD